MALIDFTQDLMAFDGERLKDFENPKKTVTLGSVCITSLMAVYEDERNLTGEEKITRYDLALAIYAAKEPLNFPVEQVALLKKLVAKAFGPLVVGQAWRMLDPDQ